MTRKSLCLLIGAGVLSLVIAACGTAATPEWAAAAQGTRVAIAATSDHETAIAPTFTPTPLPTDTPTEIPPTATPAPTETPLPPTATTVPPTVEATVEATAAATAEAPAGGGDAAAQIAAAEAAGDPEAGKTLFNTLQASTGFACSTCHSVDEAKTRIIGPPLYDIRDDAPLADAGQGLIDYLHTSIVNPQAYVVKGDPPYPENLMPQVFGTLFSDQQIKDLIAYLLTLHK